MKNVLQQCRKTRFAQLLLIILFQAGLSSSSFGQVLIPNTTAVTENFSIGASATATLPTGWRISPQNGGAAPTYAAGITATTQQASSGAPATGGIYNWGSSATERAVGILTSGSYASPTSLMVQYKNTNAQDINSVAVTFNAERYRINTAAASIQTYYSTDGATWVAAPAGNITFSTGASAYGYPQSTIGGSFSVTGLSVAANGFLYLRWNLNTTGANSQGIAIDDVSLTATFTAPSPNINVSTASVSLGTTLSGTASSVVNYTVDGTNLTTNIVITPPLGVEISTTSTFNAGTVYDNASPYSITPSSGTVASTTIYVRFPTTAPAVIYASNITHTSASATNRNVMVNGQVFLIPSVVINQAFNTSAQTEWYELLTLQTVNMQGWKFRDYSGGSVNITDQLVFTNDAVWASVPAGTLIVIYQPGNIGVEDYNPSDDGIMKIQACNAQYFTQTASPCATAPYNSIALNATQDALVLYDASTTVIHALEYNNGASGYTAAALVPQPKAFLNTTATLLANESVWFKNTSTANDFFNNTKLLKSGAQAAGTETQGLSNDAAQHTYICGTVRGTVQPTASASGLGASGILEDQITFTWTTNGTGSRRIVVARLTATSAAAPADGSIYTASATFGSGGSTTGTGNYVVYNGSTPNSVTVTSLSALTSYTFDVYEFNGLGECIDYRPTPASFTQSTSPGTSITASAVIGSPFCVSATSLSATFNQAFTTVGTFDPSNVFTVQLSDNLGSFASAVNIGSGTASPVLVTIPAGTAAGTGYLLRIVSSIPARTSNSQSLTITSAPVNVTGAAASAGNAQATISWTNPLTGCYNDIMIVARTGSFTAAVPVGSAYVSNSNDFTDVTNGTFDGGKIVYRGSSSPQVITGLTNASTYNFKIYTRVGNDWSAGVVVSATPVFTLNTGDVQIIGVNDLGTDAFIFVTWVALPAGTQLKFTDNGFNNPGASATAVNNFRGGENTVVWTAPAGGIPAGGVIMIADGGASAIVTGGGTATGNLNGLSNSGDQIFAYMSAVTQPNTNPSTFTGTILSGLNFHPSLGWLTTGTASSNTSYLPSELSPSTGNFALTGAARNASYNGSRTNQTTFAAYKPIVNNFSNWITSSTDIALSQNDFILSSGLPDVNLTVSTGSATEAASTVVTLTATITGTTVSAQTVNVSVSGTGITAGDYTLSSTTITIPAGTNTSGTVTFTVVNDVIAEGIEIATVSIVTPSAGLELGTFDSRDIAIADNDVPNLIINEIMYDSPGIDNEWIELYNNSSTAVTLNNQYQLINSSASFTYNFIGTHVIPAGGFATIQLGTNGSFPFTPTVVAFATGTDRLVNTSSTIILKFNSFIVDQVTYGNAAPWPGGLANGGGSSIALNLPSLDNSVGSNWGACLTNGSPNQANINCNSTVYYTVASGDLTDAIWSTTTTGIAIFANFSSGVDLIIQNPHVVKMNNVAAVPVRNLTINAGASKLWRNSNLTSDMAYFNLFGNLVCNGTIGNGNTFDAVGFNIEGVSCSISGNGIINLGRIRKETTTNITSSLTISSNMNLRYPGTAIYNDCFSSNFNLTISANRIVNVFGNGSSGGDVSIDGVTGTAVGESGGIWNINGTLNIVNKLYSLTNNVNTVNFSCGINIGATGVILTRDVDLRADGLADTGCPIIIASGGRIIVSGTMRNLDGSFATNNGLILQSTATLLHGAGTGGLGSDPGAPVTGNVVIRRVGDTNPGVYNYWSSPVTNATLNAIGQNGTSTGSSYNTYEYLPNNATGTDIAGLLAGWQLKPFSTPMSIGKGYITTSAGNVTFNGPVNNGTIPVAVQLGTNTKFNLVGNPFPSSVDVVSFLTANSSNIQPAIYLWDDDGSLGADYSAGDYAAANGAGAIGGGNGNTGTYTGYVAAAQGFFVEAKAGASQVVFSNSMRNTDNTYFFENQNELKRLWVNVTNSAGQYNETLLAFIPGATDERDELYDAKKLFGNQNIGLYTTLANESYCIQAWGELTTSRIIPLGLEAKLAGTHTIALKNLQNIDPTVLIYLEDLATGQMHNLRVSSYSFTLTAEEHGANRFRLHFMAPVAIEKGDETCSQNDGKIVINAPINSWNYSVSNAGNQVIAAGQATEATQIENLADGSYTVELSTDDGYSYTQNVVIEPMNVIDAEIQMPETAFTSEAVTFNSVFTGTADVSWNFGDGSAAVISDQTSHVYDEPGVYTVTIVTNNGACASTITRTINITASVTGISNLNSTAFNVYPNPAANRITISGNSGKGELVINDLTGKKIRAFQLTGNTETIDVSGIANGIYIAEVRKGNTINSVRIVIAR